MLVAGKYFLEKRMNSLQVAVCCAACRAAAIDSIFLRHWKASARVLPSHVTLRRQAQLVLISALTLLAPDEPMVMIAGGDFGAYANTSVVGQHLLWLFLADVCFPPLNSCCR